MKFSHLLILLKKNGIILWKSKRLMLCHLLAPVLSGILLVYIQVVIESFVKITNKDPNVVLSDNIPKGRPEGEGITLGYSIIDPNVENDNGYFAMIDAKFELVGETIELDFEQYSKLQNVEWINHTLHHLALK